MKFQVHLFEYNEHLLCTVFCVCNEDGSGDDACHVPDVHTSHREKDMFDPVFLF